MKTRRNFFILLVGILLIAGSAPAQVWEEWVARYNGPADSVDGATALAVDVDGNVYVTGSSIGSGTSWDYCTIKYDANGIQQWVTRYNGPGNDQDLAYSLAIDAGGNVCVTGRSVGSGTDFDFATIKYSNTGNLQWVVRYNGPLSYRDEAAALKVDADGNVYVTGLSHDIGTGRDYATIKYNAAGIQQWIARYSSTVNNSDDEPTALALDQDRNVYVTGWSQNDSSWYDYATVKYNSNGVQQWVAYLDGPGNNADRARALALDVYGNVYVTGWSQEGGPGYWYDYATVKYNAVGVQQWVSIYNGPANYYDYAEDLAVDPNGNVYVTGRSQAIPNSFDYCTIKYNPAGAEQWVTRYDGPTNSTDEASAIELGADGNIYVTGKSWYDAPPWNGFDYATIKYNDAGEEQWVAIYDGLGNSSDYAEDLAVDANANVYVTGFGVGIETESDYTTVKYFQPNISINLIPTNPPILIPPSGGSFDFHINISNSAQPSQPFDFWIMLQMPSGSWHGPVLGPINLTLPGGGSINRLRTQNIPGRAPAGTYTYRGYVGDYPAKWDSSSFTFEKLGVRDWGLGISNWDNTGEAFDGEATFITHHSSLITSVSPNPFNPATTISFGLPDAGWVKLAVYDLLGRQVALLVNGYRPAGQHEISFDAGDLSSGIYVYRLEAGDFSAVKKMVLMK